MSTLTITRGLPGAGKTTWAKEIQAKHGSVRVNRDDLRRMLFGEAIDYGDKQEKLVTQIQRDAIKASFKVGREVIADDTNLPPRRVREWFRFARANKVELKVEEFEISVEEAIGRQPFRPKHEQVAPPVLNKMARFLKNGRLQPYDLAIDVPWSGDVETYVPDVSLPKAIIVDIDGTVALMGNRSPYDLNRVHEDAPNTAVIDLVNRMEKTGTRIIFLSGREDTARAKTAQWIDTHVMPFVFASGLFMRAADDKRKDAIVKRELFDEHVRNQYNVLFVLDDRNQVVEMWRELGLTCLQVAEGDF